MEVVIVVRKTAPWNPQRVLFALGRIGYNPVSALLDIVDNSISAGATKVYISVEVEADNGGRGRPRAFVSNFLILDNGCGMDEAGIDNAIALGSSTETYGDSTLSKFGMGLKSASSSLGKQLDIVSKTDSSPLNHATLDQETMDSGFEYDFRECAETGLKEYFEQQGIMADWPSGTLVKIGKVHTDNLPTPTSIIEGLKSKAGVVYYYYLEGLVEGREKVDLYINNELVESVDPLFEDEIDSADGSLNENKWDGLTAKWITQRQVIQLAPNNAATATVTITQLPHPPSVNRFTEQSAKECRDRFLIEANNYGFYIYRNGRLISWADRLEMITRDQDLYSFRGRLEITSDSDDILNIDVTKSRIELSELAYMHLRPIVNEAKRKSKEAWNTAKRRVEEESAGSPHEGINTEINAFEEQERKTEKVDEDATPRKDREEIVKKKKRLQDKSPATDDEITQVQRHGERVSYVDTLPANQLWQRAHDPEHGLIVRVNKSHRFYLEVLIHPNITPGLLRMMDAFFFSMARGEYSLLYESDNDLDRLEEIMEQYREHVGEQLSKITRKIDLLG